MMRTSGNILLIDNNQDLLESSKRFLELHGYQIYAASGIIEARRVLLSSPIHLIITDLRVTNDTDEHDVSGLEFARDIAPSIPKIILTAFPTWEYLREALTPQQPVILPAAVAFVSKLEGLEVLLQTINKVFREHICLDSTQFKTGGALTDADSAVYIPRKAEQQAIETIRKMEYLIIIEPRQQGKTSLINYLLSNPSTTGASIIYIDIASDLDRNTQAGWYRSLGQRAIRQLGRILPEVKWPDIPNNSFEWRSFLSDLASVFEGKQSNLVIALDEIGTPIPDATGFFSVLRGVFNSRQIEPQLRRITFLLVGAFHPRDLIEDSRFSPFNIACRVRLDDFTLEQVRYLTRLVAVNEKQADDLAERVHYWTEGHPYLTQQVCAWLHPASTIADVDLTAGRLIREDEKHLPPLLKRLGNDQNTRLFMNQLINGNKVKFSRDENILHVHLELLGLIREDINGHCAVRNRIYEKYFASTFIIELNKWYQKPEQSFPMELQSFKIRVQHLADNIVNDLELLKDYEDELRYEDDPRRKARYRREAERLRRSAVEYQRELDELQSQIPAGQPSDLILVEDRLRQMEHKLNVLLIGQQVIVDGLSDLRQSLLSQYNETQRTVISAFIDRLDQSTLEILQAILNAVESNRLPEDKMSQLLNVMQEACAVLQQRGVTLLHQDKIETALSDPSLDVKHKIKFAIPLLPTILEYEAEVELGSGINLGDLWRELKKKLWK